MYKDDMVRCWSVLGLSTPNMPQFTAFIDRVSFGVFIKSFSSDQSPQVCISNAVLTSNRILPKSQGPAHL